jgi:hypothetical protein
MNQNNQLMTNYNSHYIYIVCEKSLINLPIKAFDNINDAEHFVNELSTGIRYIITIPFHKNNFQYPQQIIYNTLPSQFDYPKQPHINFHQPKPKYDDILPKYLN